jgi:hypothetical protein
MPKRSVFFISDGTGITAETLGLSLLAHFDGVPLRTFRLPFVNNPEKVQVALARIARAATEDDARPILMMTMVSAETRAQFEASGALCLDMFGTFTRPLAEEFSIEPCEIIGMSRRDVGNDYRERIEAINYTLSHDDGLTESGLQDAEVILVGVSRCGKTPTSLYLAMQFGIHVANYPIIPEDLERGMLPGHLGDYRDKLFGLSIEPERLHLIRSERRPGSHYASLDNCRREVRMAQDMMRREGIQWLDSTRRSVEEIAALVVQHLSTRSNGNKAPQPVEKTI